MSIFEYDQEEAYAPGTGGCLEGRPAFWSGRGKRADSGTSRFRRNLQKERLSLKSPQNWKRQKNRIQDLIREMQN